MLCSIQASSQDMTAVLKAFYGEQPAKAKSLLLNMLRTNPESQEVHYRLGNLYYLAGKTDSARYYYTKGIKPDDKINYNFAGMAKLALDAGNSTEAQGYIDKLITRGRSKDTKAYMFIGETWLTSANGNVEKAIEALEKAISIDYKNWEAQMLLGDAHLKTTDGGKAISSYERAMEARPELALPYVKAGQVYMAAGGEVMYGLALENFTKAYETDSTFGPAARELADFYYYVRKYPEAVRLYRKYMDLTGASIEKKSRLAGFLFMNKDYDQAGVLIKDVLRVDPSNIIMNRLLGYIKYEEEQYEEGVIYMREFFAKADPAKILASDYAYYGKLLAKAGSDSLAIVNLHKAISMDSTNPDLRFNLAEVLFKNKQFAEAAGAFQHAIRLGKASSQEYFLLGKSWYYAKEFVLADSALAKVTRLQPNAALGHWWRASTNRQLDPTSTEFKALPHYMRFTELATDTAKYKKDLVTAHEYIGTYYVHKNELQSACPHWVKVKEFDPANENAIKFLQSVDCNR